MTDPKWPTGRPGGILLAMAPRTSHIVLDLFDLLPLPAINYLCSCWISIDKAVIEIRTTIESQSGSGIYLSALVDPILHLYSAPGIKNASLFWYLLLAAALFAVLVGVFSFSNLFEHKLNSVGYVECPMV